PPPAPRGAAADEPPDPPPPPSALVRSSAPPWRPPWWPRCARRAGARRAPWAAALTACRSCPLVRQRDPHCSRRGSRGAGPAHHGPGGPQGRGLHCSAGEAGPPQGAPGRRPGRLPWRGRARLLGGHRRGPADAGGQQAHRRARAGRGGAGAAAERGGEGGQPDVGAVQRRAGRAARARGGAARARRRGAGRLPRAGVGQQGALRRGALSGAGRRAGRRRRGTARPRGAVGHPARPGGGARRAAGAGAGAGGPARQPPRGPPGPDGEAAEPLRGRARARILARWPPPRRGQSFGWGNSIWVMPLPFASRGLSPACCSGRPPAGPAAEQVACPAACGISTKSARRFKHTCCPGGAVNSVPPNSGGVLDFCLSEAHFFQTRPLPSVDRGLATDFFHA
ncbi:unnamed protein product, partial [Prorocentrum cordatum]